MAKPRKGARAAAGLEIHLLGAPRFLVDGVEVDEARWHRRQARSLVKMLVLEPSRRVHREVVMERFWPDLDPSRAANNLHKVIFAARRALEPDLGRGRSRFLHAEGQHVALDDVAWVDVETFARAAEAAEANPTAASVEAALALYTGDLLAEDLYEDWAAEHRERAAATRRRLLRLAADLYEARGDTERGGAALRALVAADPLDEAAHRRLMRLYAGSGQRGLAVKQFLDCRAAVEREIGVEPEPETVALYEAIVAGPGPGAVSPGRPGPPAPRGRRVDNLPVRATSFLGRKREVPAVAALLGRARLVTLTGPGGIGKTRLALEVARGALGTYPDGVRLVELAPLVDGALVAQAVAHALEAVDEAGERGEALLEWLAPRRMLVVLDNCEHIVEASAAFVERALAFAPDVAVLATSREALGVEGEAVWPVPSLVVPEEGAAATAEGVLASDAVRLFVDRARLRDPDFAVGPANAAAVAAICRRLDGLPLAIELAARRAGLLSPAQILERLADRFALLQTSSRVAEPRHRSLRATLDWSYESLSEPERALLRRLTVFVGSFSIEAAEAVAPGGATLDLVGRLVDTSLLSIERVAADEAGAARYRMLQTIREYGAEKLEAASESRRYGAALLDFYSRLVEAASAEFPGPNEKAWIRRIGLESDNLRAAMEVAVSYGDDESALRLAGGLGQFWSVYGFLRESRAQIEAILARTAGRADVHRARALYALGLLRRRLGDLRAAMAAFGESGEVCRRTGDRRGLARALAALAALEVDLGDAARSAALLDEAESLFRAPEEEEDLTRLAFARGLLAMRAGEHETARGHFERSLALFRRKGAPGGVMVALHNLGEVEFRLGMTEVAEAHLRESLRISEELDDRRVSADTLLLLGRVALGGGRRVEGLDLLRRALDFYAADNFEPGVAEVLALAPDLTDHTNP